MALDSERARVAHLLRRAGFGASESELDEYTALGFAGALERLLNPQQVDDSTADDQLAPLALDFGDPESRRKIEAAKFWWFNRMFRASASATSSTACSGLTRPWSRPSPALAPSRFRPTRNTRTTATRS
jgi:hypothetical protein